MNNIADTNFVDLLPFELRNDPDAIAAGKALDNQTKGLVSKINKAIIFGDLNNLDDKTADLLAIDLHLDYYDVTFDIVTKRKLIKSSLNWHRKKGTLKALKDVLKTVAGDATVQEWFEYGGRPHHFKVNIPVYAGSFSASVISKVTDVIEKYKRLSSRLDSITITGGKSNKIYYGVSVKTSIKLNIKK